MNEKLPKGNKVMKINLKAHVPIEIPPAGSRRIRLRISRVLLIAAVFSAVFGICYGIFAWMTATGRWWTGSLLIVALVTLPATYFYRELARQRRLLETGTVTEALVTKVEEGCTGYIECFSAHYEYRDPRGLPCNGETSTAAAVGSLLTVFCDPTNPQNHVLLREAYYKILKQPP